MIPQIYYMYDSYCMSSSIIRLVVTLQFEIPNFLSSVKSLQIIFYAILILSYFNALDKVQASPSIRMKRLPFNEFNQYHNLLINLIDLFNRCFGWSILVNVTRDFIFFGEGSYIMFFNLKSRNQAMLVVLIWSHIVYCVLLCGVCQLIHRKV